MASPAYAVRDVGVGPDRVDVARGAGRVGEVLLADQHQRPLRHHAAVHLPLGGRDLLEGAADVHGARAPAGLRGPRHAAAHGQVDLVRGEAVLPPGSSRPAMAANAVGVVSNIVDPGGRQVGERAHRDAGLGSRRPASAAGSPARR